MGKDVNNHTQYLNLKTYSTEPSAEEGGSFIAKVMFGDQKTREIKG